MSGKPAARISDMTACSGHNKNPIVEGSSDVLFDGLGAARLGDKTACDSAISSAVIPNVLINGKPAAVLGSTASHNNNPIVTGSGTVVIGSSHTPAEFIAPAALALTSAFNEHFVIRDASSGAPVAGRPYSIKTDSGQVIEGVTDESGRTQLVSAAKAEGVTLDLEPQTALVIA
ncbi:PAAR domain-containing protein [Pseudomonas sp. RL_15y_Pfl2_60]|uniref:PAAR domain-containing protein n=1 Tax=Pseudomonas sp. RL_15y_Pfl2_60 TaxID=3088709 RepID=UPI0030D97E2A